MKPVAKVGIPLPGGGRQEPMQCCGNRKNASPRIHRSLHNSFKILRGAPKRRRFVGEIVRRKDQPSAFPAIPFDGFEGGLEGTGFSLQKMRRKKIQIRGAGIEEVAATSAAIKKLAGNGFVARRRDGKRIRHAVKDHLREEPSERTLVGQQGGLKLLRRRLPSVAVIEGVAAKLMPFFEQRLKIFFHKHGSCACLFTHQPQGHVKGSHRLVAFQYGTSHQERGAGKIVKSEGDPPGGPNGSVPLACSATARSSGDSSPRFSPLNCIWNRQSSLISIPCSPWKLAAVESPPMAICPDSAEDPNPLPGRISQKLKIEFLLLHLILYVDRDFSDRKEKGYPDHIDISEGHFTQIVDNGRYNHT